MVEGWIKSAARGTTARAESESIEAPSRYLYLFGGLSARSPFGSKNLVLVQINIFNNLVLAQIRVKIIHVFVQNSCIYQRFFVPLQRFSERSL